jgi:two-component system chemotaxis response regulator CheY
MRQMLSIILKGAGHEVVEAPDGHVGLSSFDTSFDVVITDYNMPNMGGIELIQSIRSGSEHRQVPILMLTTESDVSKKSEGREAGATAWITKPFNRDSLLGTIEKITRTVEF